MGVTFPLSPTPSWYATCSFPTRNGIFYADGSAGQPTVILSQATATAYAVRDYSGTVVSSGAVTGTNVTPTAPTGGWPCGWYRIYFTGPSTDALYGPSYGATSFVVIPADARFPTNPAASTSGNPGFGESPDFITKGVLGIGTSRITIDNAATPTTSGNGGTIANAQAAITLSGTYWTGKADGARPRELWVNFPNQAYDRITLAGSASGTYLRVYPATGAIDGSQVFVAVAAGSTSGTKVQVYSPTSATLVETFDNLGAGSTAATTINATSAYIRAFDGGQAAGAVFAATAIGNTYRAGVSSVVSTLYPAVKHYEGPTNEPPLGSEAAQQMCVFQGAVHAGNASAKAIGPCPVNIGGGWDLFLAAGGGAWCDVFSFHDYGAVSGSPAVGRESISAWVATLTKYGQQGKPRWQTEAGMAFKSVYGVHHPRRAGWKLIHTLLWEQYGVPAERNTPWYDSSHGFWSYPDWLINGDSSLNPEAPMLHTLTAETWGKPYAAALTFGTWGDAIVVGNVYTGADGTSTIAICAAAQMPNQTATFTVTGTTGALTTVDAWGNTSTATASTGRVTIPAGATPTYLRLPAGVSVQPFSLGDWPLIGVRGQGYSTASSAAGPSTAATDGKWSTNYSGAAAMPDTYAILWATPVRFDRVLLWNSMSWQNGASLLDFDVQTTADGTTWTTRATVTKTASSFLHGTNASNAGCQYETYWDEQWIHDVKLPAPVVATGLRLNVRATSYGGEPDAQALAAGGQGGSQRIVLQEIAVLCDDNVRPQYVTR